MRRSNSGDWKMIIRTNLSILNVGSKIFGRAKWKETDATMKDFNTKLIRQEKKFHTSELFKVIENAIIPHFRTTYWFRTTSSTTFVILDVQSVYAPWQIQDWWREDKILAGTDKRKGLKFYQTKSNAVIFYDTFPACCISKQFWWNLENHIRESVCVCPTNADDFF